MGGGVNLSIPERRIAWEKNDFASAPVSAFKWISFRYFLLIVAGNGVHNDWSFFRKEAQVI